MRFLPLVLLSGLLIGPNTYGGEYEALARAVIAMHNRPSAPKPTPSPTPSPVSSVCPDCEGKGTLGDGKTSVTCTTCKGTGKKLAASVDEASESVEFTKYPLRSRWWSGCGSWRHLTIGEHAGKFDHAWLAQLSNAELQSLHSDDHDRRVKWDYVIRGSAAAKPPVGSSSGCPNGLCPGQSRVGLFQRLLSK